MLVRQYMAHRAEDMMRRMMGMPSRKEERSRRRREETESHTRTSSRGAGGQSREGARRHRRPSFDVAELLRSVAVDVEYVEIREFASTVISGGAGMRLVYEEQVSDVEYVEIRGNR